MGKTKSQSNQHGLPFRVYNAARVAVHAQKYFIIWRQINQGDKFPGDSYNKYYEFWPIVRKALFEAVVNTCAMLDDGQGYRLVSLLDELIAANLNSSVPLHDFKAELVTTAAPIAYKLALIRNNITAHRSRHQTYKQVMDRATVTEAELDELISIYVRITDTISCKTYNNNSWLQTGDPGPDTAKLLADLASIPSN